MLRPYACRGVQVGYDQEKKSREDFFRNRGTFEGADRLSEKLGFFGKLFDELRSAGWTIPRLEKKKLNLGRKKRGKRNFGSFFGLAVEWNAKTIVLPKYDR
jgi:hypothetical protein